MNNIPTNLQTQTTTLRSCCGFHTPHCVCALRLWRSCCFCFFFFNDTATTEIYTLSLHDALPILRLRVPVPVGESPENVQDPPPQDRKSTRLNSSHTLISYAGFCFTTRRTTR